MKLFVVDPGGTTGFVAAEGWNKVLLVGQSKYFTEVRKGITEIKPDLVVYESFNLYAHKALAQSGSDMPAPMIIGRLTELCDTLHIPLKSQTPSNRKIISNELLARTGWLKATTGVSHARDAARHLLLYYKNNGYAEEFYRLLED